MFAGQAGTDEGRLWVNSLAKDTWYKESAQDLCLWTEARVRAREEMNRDS